MRKITWIASIMLLAAISCTNLPTQILVDNPTKNTLSLVIGNDSVVLNAKQYKLYNLAEGEYRIKYADTIFKLTVSDKNLILNPTRSAYILEQAIYSGNKSNAKERLREDRIPQDTILLSGTRICGNLKCTSEIVITEDFDYGIHQEFPKSVKLFYPKEKLLVKISREEDFLDAKMKEMQIKTEPMYSNNK